MVEICVIALIGLPASGKTMFCKTVLACSSIQYNCIHICYDEMFTFVAQSSEISFKDERKRVLQTIEERIVALKLVENTQPNPFIIFCDDNNYYTGMRYEIYKVCKRHQLSFGQIYFGINLKESLLRNSTRGTTALPRGIIEQMNKRLQVPSAKNQWERNTLTMGSLFNLEELNAFIQICLRNPLKHMNNQDIPSNVKVNVTHEVDIQLRKRIKKLLQDSDGDLRKKANVLNERRKNILLEIKEKKISEADLDIDYFLDQLISDL